jgi:Protein of unknown function (DUF3306)
MSSARGDFLARWSRRKLEMRQSEPDAQPVPAPPPETDLQDSEPEPEEAGLTPEEVADLPKIEELTPETDIRLFLRRGVPDLLRKAALRRMWSLDPAIREYVSEAREYAYDWNVPGGVPGNGPLLPTDNVEEMLGRIFGDRPRIPDPLPPAEPAGRVTEPSRAPLDADVTADGAAGPPGPSPDHDEVQQHGLLPTDPAPAGESGPGEETVPDETSGGSPRPAIPPSEAATSAGISPRRRHGGATPV